MPLVVEDFHDTGWIADARRRTAGELRRPGWLATRLTMPTSHLVAGR